MEGANVSLADRLEPYLLETAAVDRVAAYVHGRGDGRYSGSWFDTYPAPPRTDSPVGGNPDQIDADDLIATTMLSIEVRLRSTSGFDPLKLPRLHEHGDAIAGLLQRLPANLDLHDLDEAEYERLVGGDDAPANRLWHLIRQDVEFPPIASFKLLARKRPRLLPIRDGVLRDALGKQEDWWGAWWQTLRSRPDLVSKLADIKNGADAPTLSLLRVADVAVWMKQKAS